jgi:glucose/arabinose dehydrogenase
MPHRAALLLLATLSCAFAKPGTVKIASGFERPLWIGAPPNDNSRLWVIEQAGRIWNIDTKNNEKSKQPVLDIVSQVSRQGNEEGLLGLAFSPDFARTGRFYVNFVDRSKFTRIVRYVMSGEHVDPASGEDILSFKQPYENHNGGWLSFGPDGFLYIGTGDGGSQNDPHNNGQSLNTYLGKLLRIDVSGPKGYTIPSGNPFRDKPDAKPEIWAYGLRNPWRCSFDSLTGDLWIGDVGQNTWEEVDFLPKNSPPGANFGWRLREGDKPTPQDGVGGEKPPGAIDPVYVYGHGGSPSTGMSVTGGYLYRGPVPELAGRYVFGDYQNARIWSFVLRNGKAADFKDHTEELEPEGGHIMLISSFGTDARGNLYIVDLTGPVYRVISR